MTLSDELLALTQQGVQLWVDDAELRVRAPRGALTPSGREVLRTHKDEIVALLRHAPHLNAAGVRADQDIVSGPIPLTPRQHHFFQTEVRREDANITFYEIRGALERSFTQRAVERLLVHHDNVRTRFRHGEDGWFAVISEREEHELLSYLDINGLSQREAAGRIQLAIREARSRIHIEDGPLLQAVLVSSDADGESRLVFLIHHLVVDPRSIGILVKDFELAYDQQRRGEDIRLPPKTSSFKLWAERLLEHAQSSQVTDELNYWLAAIPDRAAPLPVDHPEAIGADGRVRRVFLALDPGETDALFHDVPRMYGTQSDRVVLAALARAFRQWCDMPGILVELTGHGRESLFPDVDISRTVGWFTTQFPVFLDVGFGLTVHEEIQAVDDTLRRVPNAGIGYGLLRYLCQDRELAGALEGLPRCDVTLNYVGRGDVSPGGMSPLLLEAHLKQQVAGVPGRGQSRIKVVTTMYDGRLYLRLGYHDAVYEQASIEHLAELIHSAVRAMLP